MMRYLLITCLFASSLCAQSSNPFLGGGSIRQAPVPQGQMQNSLEAPVLPEPVLTADIFDDTVMPGQALRLRLTILVPTFMPTPPVWPSFEQPDILVRLPERSSNPTSRTIDGDSWSGITRQYQITPLVPGHFTLPAQEVRVTWSDPTTGQAIQTMMTTPEIEFASQVPDAAMAMDPFIAAQDLTLTQTIEGHPDGMTLGDSLSREVAITVKGVDPMVLPGLLTSDDISGLATYPDTPSISQSPDGGRRVERIVYVAETGGDGVLPTVQLDWYDIDDGQIRSAQVEGVSYSIKGAPIAPHQPVTIVKMITGVLLGTMILGLLIFRIWPLCHNALARRRSAYLASESFAWSQLIRMISAKDHRRVRLALDLWGDRWIGPDPRKSSDVQSALYALGAAHYGGVAATDHPWDTLLKALKDHRRSDRSKDARPALPPLNPATSPDLMS